MQRLARNEPTESVPQMLAARAIAEPDSVLIEEVQGLSMTTDAFHARTLKVASVLYDLGVRPGDCVATMLSPRIEAYVSWIGICWAGAMEVPVNPEFRGNSLIYGLNDSQARVLITSTEWLDKISAAKPDLPHLQHVLVVDRDDDTISSSALSLPDLIDTATVRDFPAPQLGDPYAVIYTSGTTGPSKGVVIPWGSIQYSLMSQMFAGDDPTAYSNPAYYSPWPMYHAASRSCLVFALGYRGRMVVRDRLSVSAYWADIRQYGCTHSHLIGIANFLMVQPPKADDADNPLQRVLMNPVLPEYREFEKRFGLTISVIWGMTEIGLPTSASNLPNAQTCGTLSELYEVRIVDDKFEDVPVGEVGQLLVRPKRRWLLLREYLNKPEANAKSWRDGWFLTGDALKSDADGNYYFVDRLNDYMRVRGNNVSSLEVENEVRAHPAIADVAAIGLRASADRSSTVGRAVATEDDIKIVVSLKEGAVLSPRELLEFLIPRLPRFMTPRYIQIVDEFPRTGTGKIQKQALRQNPPSTDVWDRVAAGVEVPR